MTGRARWIVTILIVGASLVVIGRFWAQLFGAPQETSISIGTGAEDGWPVIYSLTINGAAAGSLPYDAITGTGSGYRGSGLTVTPVPAPSGETAFRVETSWIEWRSGAAWTAALDFDLAGLRRDDVTIYFAPGGAVSAWVAGEQLQEGPLGRAATKEDYRRIAAACGTPLPQDSALYRELADLRDSDYRLDPSRVAEPAPAAGQAACDVGE